MNGHLPPLFIGHGSPMTLMDHTPARAFMEGLAADYERAFGRPRAILCASAHWETRGPAVSGAARPETIHDFGGFPEALHRLRYAAPGAPALAARVVELLPGTVVDPNQGLDHGAWVPLSLIWPAADIPVAQLAVQPHLGPAHHVALGRALAALADEGVLVMGSGLLTHNLRQLAPPGSPIFPWAREFDDWFTAKLQAEATDDLVHYRERAPHATVAHPRDEHLLPIYIAYGAAGAGTRAVPIHRSFEYGGLSMASWRFDPAP